jgi:hypothetical protein
MSSDDKCLEKQKPMRRQLVMEAGGTASQMASEGLSHKVI